MDLFTKYSLISKRELLFIFRMRDGSQYAHSLYYSPAKTKTTPKPPFCLLPTYSTYLWPRHIEFDSASWAQRFTKLPRGHTMTMESTSTF